MKAKTRLWRNKRLSNLNENPRVFLGLLDICGVYRSLEEGFKTSGIDACFVNVGKEHRQSSVQYNWIVRAYIFASNLNTSVLERPTGTIMRLLVLLYSYYATMLMIVWITFRFDILIFKSGLSFSETKWDMRWFKFIGKKIVVSYHGSDSRPAYLHAKPVNWQGNDEAFFDFLNVQSREQKRQTKLASTYADLVVDSPASAHFQSGRVLLRQAIFNPVPNSIIRQKNNRMVEANAFRILHAPSDASLKGTEIIRNVIEELQLLGFNIDYRELVGVSNSEVLRSIGEADLVIDELYSDNYGGIFALEALAAQTPVIVGGYAHAVLDKFTSPWMRAPTIYIDPCKLKETLVQYLNDPSLLETYRQEAFDYTQNRFSSMATATRLLRAVKNDAPPDWFFNPDKIDYVLGATAPKEKIIQNIRKMVKINGPSSLQLDEKAELRLLILNLTSTPDAGCSESDAPC